MKYEKVVQGVFLRRPNRFIADVSIDGKTKQVHVKNTGRCRELLTPGATVYLEDVREKVGRKTGYNLIAAEKKDGSSTLLINLDSQAPNRVAEEALREGRLSAFWGQTKKPQLIRREVVYGTSRFDLYAEDEGLRALIEVKGVTLNEDGTALFPDAPTQRGIKHIRELIRAKSEGYEAALLFVIQMKEVRRFCPNEKTHREFGEELRKAWDAGVRILAYNCNVKPDWLSLERPVPVELRSCQ